MTMLSQSERNEMRDLRDITNNLLCDIWNPTNDDLNLTIFGEDPAKWFLDRMMILRAKDMLRTRLGRAMRGSGM